MWTERSVECEWCIGALTVPPLFWKYVMNRILWLIAQSAFGKCNKSLAEECQRAEPPSRHVGMIIGIRQGNRLVCPFALHAANLFEPDLRLRQITYSGPKRLVARAHCLSYCQHWKPKSNEPSTPSQTTTQQQIWTTKAWPQPRWTHCQTVAVKVQKYEPTINNKLATRS